MYLCFGCTAG
uniref:Fatty acyl-CoA reductase CG30427-like protein n=1 Tax=Triatoma infestans TaxID=30076 RepID=A0A161MCT0_TRIIF